ncbi:alpha/beta fold hydrolase [Thioclava atlantica]|uniref:Alpha/beta fold family hydrolase n=1 Tax=Thioclava atlantica TaxID=1317124 RepID=A0A085U1V8_9RHOB|nr:alpha/beta hydrolase [Thioclava atlantica]KFE36955.1 alpha/beta fold family hydrolase [Thioclava atlantica]
MPRDLRQGAEIFWQSFGHGARPAIAIHCTLGSSNLWAGALEPFAGELSTIAFDQPSHGQSAPWRGDPAEPGAFQTQVTRIAASFIERPVDLIGHSFGASVALRIAVGAPEAVRSLTLIEPVLFAALPESDPDWQALRAKQDHFEALMAEGDCEPAAHGFMRDWGTGQPWESYSEAHRERFIASMPMVENISRANFEDPAGIARAGGIEGIDAPAMIIHGDRSPPTMPKVAEAIAARLPDVGVACIQGAGHMLPVTHPAQCADLIAANLERS